MTKKLTIPAANLQGSLTDFPMVILTKDLIPGGMTQAQADSIRIYKNQNKTNEIPREIASKDVVWTKLNVNNTSDNIIYIDWDGIRNDYPPAYPNGREDVWSIHHELVLHFNDEQIIDSAYGTIPDAAHNVTGNITDGIIEKSLNFVGNTYLDYGLTKFDLGTKDVYFSVWINTVQNSIMSLLFDGSDNAENNRYGFIIRNNKADVYWPAFGQLFSQNTICDGNWHKIDALMDRDGDAKIYIDGLEESSLDISMYQNYDLSPTMGKSYIGAWDNYTGSPNSFFYNGKMAELSFGHSIPSPNHIATSYANQNNPSAFYTVSDAAPFSNQVLRRRGM